MKTSRFARRVICLTAASALLLQSAAPAYAAPKPSKELDAKLNRAIEAASARRPATAREFCARLSVCADEMNEAVLFTPYMPAQSAASFEAGDWYGALSKEETAAFFSLFDQARAAYAKAAFLSEEQFELLLRVFPSFAAAVPFSRNEKARRALEQIGRGRLFRKHGELDEYEVDEMVNSITSAAIVMGRRKIGALIVIEREIGLEERIETGVAIDGLISDSLLLNIFEKDTPLHDGAVIIRGNRIAAASCLLPLTEMRNLSQELGTRHRAALGISEQSDAVILVVSEETGTISLARNGTLQRYLTADDVKEFLKASITRPKADFKQMLREKIRDLRGDKK